MNRIFIEAKGEKSSECNFLKAVLKKYFPDREVAFVCMDGVANLFNESNLNQMRLAMGDGDNVLILLDADTPAKGWGYDARKNEVSNCMLKFNIGWPFFLYPDNSGDGDVEVLMEAIARKDLHEEWWDCFEDYEKCVEGVKDDKGEQRYNLPNRKAKLNTFISSQRLSRAERNRLGTGFWLFDDIRYWDLSRPALEPLIDFFKVNLK